MITGAHSIIYTSDPDGVRAFFRAVLELPSVDAGHGWLIFALPPAEVAAHPTDEPGGRESAHPADRGGRHELYVMCDDIQATVDELQGKGVVTGPRSSVHLQ